MVNPLRGITGIIAGLLLAAATAAAEPEPAKLTSLRLGLHGEATRIVLDMTAPDVPSRYRLSDDQKALLIETQALPDNLRLPARLGLVRTITTRPIEGDFATELVFTAAAPLAIVDVGALTPDEAHQSYRLYVDLAPAVTP